MAWGRKILELRSRIIQDEISGVGGVEKGRGGLSGYQSWTCGK